MIFPGLSRFSVPLLGAGQPPARAGPPPDSFRRVPQTDPEGKGPGGGIRVRVLINAAGTAHLQDLRRSAMSGAARPPAGSRPGSLFLRRHPKAVQGPSRRRARIQVVPPRWRASGLVGLDNGRMLHRRSQSGHKARHHPARRAGHSERSQQQLRSRRSDVAGSVDRNRGRGAVVSDLRPRHRRSTASALSDQEPADARTARWRALRQFRRSREWFRLSGPLSQLRPARPRGPTDDQIEDDQSRLAVVTGAPGMMPPAVFSAVTFEITKQKGSGPPSCKSREGWFARWGERWAVGG